MRHPLLCLLFSAGLVTAAEPDGGLDPQFGDGGRSYFGYLESDTMQMRAVAKFPASGRIWMFGDDPEDRAAIYIARTFADGQPDTGFGPGADGRRRTLLPVALIPQVESLALDGAIIQNDGKPIVFGALQSANGETGPFPALVCRLTASGTLDGSFDSDGCKTIRSFLDPQERCRVTDVAIAPDDTLVVIGNCSADTLVERPFVARLTTSGAFDFGFGAGVGIVTPALPAASAYAQHFEAVAVRPDGRIAVLGTFEMASNGVYDLELGLVQFDNGGSFDTEFGNNGFRSFAFDLGGDNHERARDLALHADGRLLALGEAKLLSPLKTVAVLAQVDADGDPDASFGPDGMRVENIDDRLSFEAAVASLELDAQGRALIAGSEVAGQPQGSTDMGTDFWFAMVPSVYPITVSRVMISSDVAATGTLSSPSLAQTYPFAVAAGVPALIELPESVQDMQGSNGQVLDLSLHVTATAPVSVVPMNGRSFSIDTSAIQQVPALGQEFRVMSWDSGLGVGSELLVVAAHDDTQVTINPRAVAAGHPAGTPFQVSLQQGNVFYLRADAPEGDLSGTTVVASRPVAVLSGHTCAYVPDGIDYCDLAYEQQQPLSRWGSTFMMVPSAGRPGGDVIRILAHEADTSVYSNGQRIATLMPGEVHDVLRSNPTLISTSKPASVAKFARACAFDQVGDDCLGDPNLLMLEPIGRWAREHLVTLHDPSFDGHPAQLHLTLIAPQDALASVQIDGAPFPAANFTHIAGTGLAYARVLHAPGSARVSASRPISVSVASLAEGEAYAHNSAAMIDDASAATADDLILRLKPDGNRDADFGSNGLVAIAHAAYVDRPLRAFADGGGILVGTAVHQAEADQDLMLTYRIEAGALFKDSFE